jgi:methylmalonyl-CoA mutase
MNDIGHSDSADHLFGEFSAPTKEQWKEQVVSDLKGADFDRLTWKTYEGFTVEPMYVRQDIDSLAHIGSLPGLEPYVRGTTALGHAAKPWTIAQMTHAPLPDAAAEEVVHARRNGQDGSALRLDEAAVLACGSEDASAYAGSSGISLQHLTDFLLVSERLQTGIPMDIHAGMSSPVFLAMAAAAERSVSHVDFNPFAHMISTGELPFSIDTVFRLMHDAVRYVDQRSMPTTVIAVCGDCYHNAGASAVQEVACMMASGVEYMNRLTDLGLTPDAVARRVRFNIPVGMSFFMEIAKLRAARLLWARVTAGFGVKEEDARKMRMHVRTSWWHQTKYDPYVNMLRATIESMAGVIGGAASMYTAPFDEVASTPGAFSKRIARNLQIILREEARLGQVADPAAGSYYIEALTDAVANHSWTLFQEIERRGGYLASAQSGFIQDIIETTAAEKRANISRRRDVIVGSNQYPNLGEKPLENETQNREAIADRINDSLRAHVATRTADTAELARSLRDGLRNGSGNIIAGMAAALQQGITVAEINDVLRNGGADAQHVRQLRPFRAAEAFERLRDAVTVAESKPRVFLATYGPGFWRRARATFASGFFGAAGLVVMDNPGFDTPEAAATAALEASADIIVACSDDESYAASLPRLIEVLRNAGSGMLVAVAGYPKDCVEDLEKCGVDMFIHVKSDVGATLQDLLRRLGIATEQGNEEKP